MIQGNVVFELAAFGVASGTFPCRVQFDVLGRPNIIEVQLPVSAMLFNGLSSSPESVRGMCVKATLDDGMVLNAEVAIFSGWVSDLGANLWASLHISRSTLRQHFPSDGDHWRVRLSNIRIQRGDSTRQVSTGTRIDYLSDSIAFKVASREWTLTDTLWQQWNGSSKPDENKPLASGLLETPFLPGDTHEAIELIAGDIEALLRFVLCKGISWYCCELVSGGQVVQAHFSSRWTKPFRVGGSPVISNITPSQLKLFIEAAYPVFSADREWFNITLLLYSISRMGDHIEIRSALQNTLLDRLAAWVLRNDDTAEIDHELSTRITKGWKAKLHELMREASPHWTQQRTGQLISSIKDWNAGPSFPGGVERAAVRLGLWPPLKAFLAKRHKLIHLGEYDSDDGTPIFEYWKQIECLVTMILLRLLGYEGDFYHLALGNEEKCLRSLMLGGSDCPPYRIQPYGPHQLVELMTVGAFFLWDKRGRPQGDDWTDWFIAESNIQQVLRKLSPNPNLKSGGDDD
jgi:hypothetical protein